MNILIRSVSGKVFSRPDTTADRAAEDVYAPEFVSAFSYAPVLFARVCRAGRSVSERFAERYFDAIGYGILLYPDDLLDGSAESVACASCIDHTSFLPMDLLPRQEAGKAVFSIEADGSVIYEAPEFDLHLVCKGISEVSSRAHIRTADLVAMELSAPAKLCSRPSTTHLKAYFNEKTTIDFNINMNLL